MTPPLQTAKRVSTYGDIKRAKVSAIAFSPNGHIIATAHNRRLGQNNTRFTEHAEEALIHKLNRIRAWNRFGTINILVLRTKVSGVAMAKPCIKCQRILQTYPVTVFYTNETGDVVRLR